MRLLYCYNIVPAAQRDAGVTARVRHLVANAELAIRTGVPRERVVLCEDGVVVDLVDGVAKVVGAVPCGYVYVDGSSVGEITEVDLKDRRILGEEGFISIVVVVDSGTGKIVAGPEIHMPAGSPRTTRSSTRSGPRSPMRWHRRRRTARATPTPCSRSCAGSSGAGWPTATAVAR